MGGSGGFREAFNGALREQGRGEARTLRREPVTTTRKGVAMKRILMLKTAAGAACMTFALMAGAQTTTNSTAPSGSSESVGQHVDDATITTKVKAELLGAKNVKSEHIHVKTRKGVVSLTGSVPSAEDRDNAKQVVEGVSGVTSVKNHLKVSAAG